QRDHRPQHRQPQEQNRSQLVRPDNGLVQHVARHHAGQQHYHLHHHQQRRRPFAQHAQDAVGLRQQGGATALPDRRPRQRAGRPGSLAFVPARHQDTLPTDSSSSAQASAPNFFFHSS